MGIKFVSKATRWLPLYLIVACSSDPAPPNTQNDFATQTGSVLTLTGGVVLGTGGIVPGTGGVNIVTGGIVATTGGAVGVTGGIAETGGIAVTGGVVETGGIAETGGVAETGGAAETGGTVTSAAECTSGEPKFSFFVTSLETMQEQSGSQNGFGGDLGGLSGADSICQTAAANVGCDNKIWRAFLSATDDGTGNEVHAIDRIGAGPWYDARGLLISQNADGLINRGRSAGQGRPVGDTTAVSDLANEFGEGLDSAFGRDDNHDIVTGTNEAGHLAATEMAGTCNDWTSTTVSAGGLGFFGGGVQCGHAWPAGSGYNWIEAHGESSCAAGVNLVQNGPGDGSSIGAGGGWGAIYCFALQP